MRKIAIVFAFVAVLFSVACTNNCSKENCATDSTKVALDTTKKVAVDTTKVADTTKAVK